MNNGMDSPFKDGITLCQAGRQTNQLFNLEEESA